MRQPDVSTGPTNGEAAEPDDLLELIGDLYQAGGDEAHWPVALRRLSGLFDDSGIFILTLDHRTGDVPSSISHDLPPEGVLEYTTRFARLDPLTHYAIANPHTVCIDDVTCCGAAQDQHDEFYTWLQRNMGYRYRLQARLFEANGRYTYARLKRTREQGPWDPKAAVLFQKLVPHLSRAVRLSQRLGDLEMRQIAFDETADRLPYGIVSIDSEGNVIRKNRLAEKIIGDADGLGVEQGRLRARLPKIDRQLQSVLQGAMTTVSGMGGNGGALAIPRPSGKQAYTLLVSPLKPTLSVFATERFHAAVFINDPERMPDSPTDRLSQLYGLTAKEAQLAVLLTSGNTLEQVAERLEIARGTARVHLERVFKKIGVRRQVELVRLLLNSSVLLE